METLIYFLLNKRVTVETNETSLPHRRLIVPKRLAQIFRFCLVFFRYLFGFFPLFLLGNQFLWGGGSVVPRIRVRLCVCVCVSPSPPHRVSFFFCFLFCNESKAKSSTAREQEQQQKKTGKRIGGNRTQRQRYKVEKNRRRKKRKLTKSIAKKTSQKKKKKESERRGIQSDELDFLVVCFFSHRSPEKEERSASMNRLGDCSFFFPRNGPWEGANAKLVRHWHTSDEQMREKENSISCPIGKVRS